MATVYSAVAVPVNARADDLSARAYPPAELAELVKWHSNLTVISESCVNPEWKSALIAIDPEESMASRVWHGTDGLLHAAKDELDSSTASFDAPKVDRKSARFRR
jgi:hypothetical protein